MTTSVEGHPYQRLRIDNVEDYSRGVNGFEVRTIADGGIGGSTTTTTLDCGNVKFTAAELGFSFLTEAAVDDGVVILPTVFACERGSRWCGFDLEPGTTLLYALGAEHTSHVYAGLEFAFAAAPLDEIGTCAEGLKVDLEPLRPRSVSELAPAPRVRELRATLKELRAAAEFVDRAPVALTARLLATMTLALAKPIPLRSSANRGVSSTQVVADCCWYAEAIGRIPSIAELCLAARVSERRLRSAFVDEYDLPPTRFFRMWALDRAHRLLGDSGEDIPTVTQVASDLGFGHLGRFAGYYRTIYGESPSDTVSGARP